MLPSRCQAPTRSGATHWRSSDQQLPRRRQIVRRHVIIEETLPRGGPIDALGDAKGGPAAEHRAAAVAWNATRPFHRDPGRRARTAAELAGRRIVGQLDGRAAVSGAFPIMTNEVTGARACRIAPA